MKESNKSSVNPDRKLSVLYSFQKVFRLMKANSMSHSFLWTHIKLIELCDITHDTFFVHHFYHNHRCTIRMAYTYLRNIATFQLHQWHCCIYVHHLSIRCRAFWEIDLHSCELHYASPRVYSYRGKHRASTYNAHVINKWKDLKRCFRWAAHIHREGQIVFLFHEILMRRQKKNTRTHTQHTNERAVKKAPLSHSQMPSSKKNSLLHNITACFFCILHNSLFPTPRINEGNKIYGV